MKKTKVLLILVFILFFMPISAQDSLIGYWDFNNIINGSFKDHSNNNNDGSATGAQVSAGIQGTAILFDGVNGYAYITEDGQNPPSVLSTLGEGSISVWFKVNRIPTDHGIAPILYYGSSDLCDFFDAANQGLIIEVGHSPVHYKSERLYFTIWKNGCTFPSFCFDSSSPIVTDEWYHFVAVVGKNYNTGFLNGVEMTDRNYNFGSSSSSQFFEDAILHEEFWLGKGHWDRTEQYLDGAIDELKIFNKPLSATEVSTLYNEVNVTSTGGIKENSNFVNAYPNPATNVLNIDVSKAGFKIKEISLVNSLGQKIISNSDASNFGQIRLDGISPGIYNLLMEGEKELIHQKILIVK